MTMKYIKIIILLITVLVVNLSVAQQDPHYTQYMYNMDVINPAYTSTNETTTLGLMARSQWVEIEGAPKTVTFSFSTPVGRSVGLGLSVVHDEIGPVKENNVYLNFAYKIYLSQGRNLSFGIKAGLTSLDVGFLNPLAGNDPLNVPINLNAPNIGAGFFYYTNRFYAGLSAPNLLKTRHLEKNNNIVTTASEDVHLFFTSGFVFDIDDNLKFKPSTMIRGVKGAPLSIDISSNLLVNDKVEFGLSHRLEDSISAMVGFFISDNFRIGYAYDHTLSLLGGYNSGSHEIMLLYSFNNRNSKSPRFF